MLLPWFTTSGRLWGIHPAPGPRSADLGHKILPVSGGHSSSSVHKTPPRCTGGTSPPRGGEVLVHLPGHPGVTQVPSQVLLGPRCPRSARGWQMGCLQ